MLLQDESVLVHDVLAKYHGQELVVRDVLHDGSDDVTSLLQDRKARVRVKARPGIGEATGEWIGVRTVSTDGWTGSRGIEYKGVDRGKAVDNRGIDKE